MIFVQGLPLCLRDDFIHKVVKSYWHESCFKYKSFRNNPMYVVPYGYRLERVALKLRENFLTEFPLWIVLLGYVCASIVLEVI
jgi:hypothetical protein